MKYYQPLTRRNLTMIRDARVCKFDLKTKKNQKRIEFPFIHYEFEIILLVVSPSITSLKPDSNF